MSEWWAGFSVRYDSVFRGTAQEIDNAIARKVASGGREPATFAELFEALWNERDWYFRFGSTHPQEVVRNPDLAYDDPRQREGRHTLCRLYSARAYYVLTYVTQPKEDSEGPNVFDVLADLTASTLTQAAAGIPNPRLEKYQLPIPLSAVSTVAKDDDILYVKFLRMPLLFPSAGGLARWDALRERILRLPLPSSDPGH